MCLEHRGQLHQRKAMEMDMIHRGLVKCKILGTIFRSDLENRELEDNDIAASNFSEEK
jgi:hypothetical protein